MKTIIEIYEAVLNQKIKRFPAETWSPCNGGYENFTRCLRYLILEKLKWDREDTIKNINFQFLKKHKLAGAAQTLYQYHTLNIVNDSFPEWNIKGWELSAVPPYFWNEETVRESIRYYYLTVLKWKKEDFLQKFKAGDLKATRYNEAAIRFREMELYKKVGRKRNSAYALLLFCFPEFEFKLWEFQNTMESWEIEDIRAALKYLIEEKLEWDYNTILQCINKYTFIDNGMGKMFKTFFRGSTYRAMSFLYPENDWTPLMKNKDKNFKNKPDYSFHLYKNHNKM